SALALGEKSKAKASESCPFVGMADIDKSGSVTNYSGTDLPKAGTLLVAFDSEGKAGQIKVGKDEKLRFSGPLPERFKNAIFSHVILLEQKRASAKLLEAEDDLPPRVSAQD